MFYFSSHMFITKLLKAFKRKEDFLKPGKTKERTNNVLNKKIIKNHTYLYQFIQSYAVSF